MIVQGWLLVGGSELGFLDILRKFAEAGFRVTMVFTRFKYPEGVALRPRVAQYTHDIHFMPAFLRMHDFPRYIKYLINSRGVDTVFMSNSVLIYEILPSLAELTPQTSWIDYLHNEVGAVHIQGSPKANAPCTGIRRLEVRRIPILIPRFASVSRPNAHLLTISQRLPRGQRLSG